MLPLLDLAVHVTDLHWMLHQQLERPIAALIDHFMHFNDPTTLALVPKRTSPVPDRLRKLCQCSTCIAPAQDENIGKDFDLARGLSAADPLTGDSDWRPKTIGVALASVSWMRDG